MSCNGRTVDTDSRIKPELYATAYKTENAKLRAALKVAQEIAVNATNTPPPSDPRWAQIADALDVTSEPANRNNSDSDVTVTTTQAVELKENYCHCKGHAAHLHRDEAESGEDSHG